MIRRILSLLLLCTSGLVAAGTTPPAGVDYELRGFFGAGDNTEVSLRRVGTENSHWYHLGQKSAGVLVEKADSKTGVAIIIVNGSRRTLRLAGEGTKSPEELRRELRRQRGLAMSTFIKQWSEEQHGVMNKILMEDGAALFREHPEYFNESASGSPEAKAALLAIARKAILAGTATPGTDGTKPVPPENLNDLIGNLCSNISITLRHGSLDVPEEWKAHMAKPITRYTTVTVDDSAPTQTAVAQEGDDARYIGISAMSIIGNAMQWEQGKHSFAEHR